MSVPAGRALVIGGSLAGLFAGLLLRRQFAVEIYERADAELAGRGAGIVTHELLGEALDAAEIAWREGLGIEVQTRRFFERDGRLGLEYPYRQTLTAWDRLYDMLRRAFPAAHYHCGKELVAVEERSGGRRYNLVWYRPADDIELQRLLTDEAGTLHALSIPPPLISRAVIADMREAAEAVLAPQFRDLIRLVDRPILQAIYDIESPRMAFGRVALIGDAAFVARPHVGAGVVKAAQDALALTRALERADDIAAALKRMEATQRPFGRRIIARARALGACLQPHHATAAERANAARFRTPQATLQETATLDFLDTEWSGPLLPPAPR